MTDAPTFLVVTETPAESWKRDTSTFFLAFACFVPGWALGMLSMSILGGLILTYLTLRSALKIGGKAMSADDARAKIAEIEAKAVKEQEA